MSITGYDLKEAAQKLAVGSEYGNTLADSVKYLGDKIVEAAKVEREKPKHECCPNCGQTL